MQLTDNNNNNKMIRGFGNGDWYPKQQEPKEVCRCLDSNGSRHNPRSCAASVASPRAQVNAWIQSESDESKIQSQLNRKLFENAFEEAANGRRYANRRPHTTPQRTTTTNKWAVNDHRAHRVKSSENRNLSHNDKKQPFSTNNSRRFFPFGNRNSKVRQAPVTLNGRNCTPESTLTGSSLSSFPTLNSAGSGSEKTVSSYVGSHVTTEPLSRPTPLEYHKHKHRQIRLPMQKVDTSFKQHRVRIASNYRVEKSQSSSAHESETDKSEEYKFVPLNEDINKRIRQQVTFSRRMLEGFKYTPQHVLFSKTTDAKEYIHNLLSNETVSSDESEKELVTVPEEAPEPPQKEEKRVRLASAVIKKTSPRKAGKKLKSALKRKTPNTVAPSLPEEPETTPQPSQCPEENK